MICLHSVEAKQILTLVKVRGGIMNEMYASSALRSGWHVCPWSSHRSEQTTHSTQPLYTAHAHYPRMLGMTFQAY